MSRSLRHSTLVIVLAVLAACGSTADLDQRQVGAGDPLSPGGGNGIGVTSGSTQSGAPSTGVTPGAAAPGGSSAAGGGGPSVSAAPLVGSTETAAAGEPIRIGLMYSTDTNTALAAMGANSRVGDAREVQDVLIEYVNANDGIAGHPLEAAYHNVSAVDTPSAISQQACEQWTQDDGVFVAVPFASVQDNELMRACLSKAGVPGIYPNFYSETASSGYAETPLWFELESLSLESWARTYATGLDAQGFFDDGAKVGVVYDDGPTFTKVAEEVLLPALDAVGADVVATATNSIHGVNDLAGGSSQMSNAVLSFRTAGVTKVLFFEVWQGWFLFARHAESQGWRPIYGLSSQNAPQIMIESGLVELNQLPGANVVGWNPGVDVLPSEMGSWPRKDLCAQIFLDAGIDISTAGAQGHHGGLAICSSFLTLLDAGKLVDGDLSPQSLARALEALGASAQNASLPTTRLGPGRHFGAAAWRPMAYDSTCTCFHYTGAPTPID